MGRSRKERLRQDFRRQVTALMEEGHSVSKIAKLLDHAYEHTKQVYTQLKQEAEHE